MNRNRRKMTLALAGALMALAAPRPCAFAAPGAAGASFLRFVPDPRATGMGEAQAALTADAYSVYWNPAGLAAVKVPELSAMYNSSFENVDTQYLAAAYPLEPGSAIAFGISRLSVAPFQGYDSIGVKTHSIDSYGTSAGLAYGRVLSRDASSRPVISAGAGLKYIGSTLDTVYAGTFGIDLGAVYSVRPSSPWVRGVRGQELRFGLAVRDLGPGLKYDSEITPLPTAASFGAAWLGGQGTDAAFALTLDNVLRAGDGYYAAFGAEYTALRLMSLRAGYRTGQDIGSGFRAGIGFHLSSIDLDYSFSPFGDLGAMHKFGLSMAFGAPSRPAPAAAGAKPAPPVSDGGLMDGYSADLLASAQKDIDGRRYVRAAGEAGRALDLRPALRAGPWGAKQRRLEDIAAGLRLREQPEREDQLSAPGAQAGAAAAAIKEYVAGGDQKALLLAHAAAGENAAGPEVFSDLLKTLARLTGMPVRSREILPKGELFNLKMASSETAFRNKDFAGAVRDCDEALMLDPASPLAWKRLGSAHFANGDTEKARAAYRRALELAPEDKSILKFMALQGWR